MIKVGLFFVGTVLALVSLYLLDIEITSRAAAGLFFFTVSSHCFEEAFKNG